MSPDQVEAIIRKLLEQGVTLNAASYLAIVILSALFAVAGGFFASYLGEKGKNRATREDFDKLTEQLKQTTRVAEDIKAQVSNESWLRQQIWAEKRRLYAEILQAFEDVRYAASGMSHFHRLMQKQEEEKTKEMLLTQVASHGESYRKARVKVMQSASAGQIIFSADAWAILDAFRKSLANDEATDIQGYFDALAASSSTAVDSLASAAKTDLGLT